jgi:hypothetical protein
VIGAATLVAALFLTGCDTATETPAAPIVPTILARVATAEPGAGQPVPELIPVIGGVDGVGGTLTTGGQALVVGWAVDVRFGAPVTRVEVVLDGTTTFPAVLGDDRPDVASALNRGDARYAGWVSTIDLTGVAPGKHTLTVLVYDTDQRAHILPFTHAFDVN